MKRTDKSAATAEMRRSYLVQRLNKPHRRDTILGKLGESLAFGGGFRNGGLSTEAMSLLGEVFSFDYMGAAEFEFGAVPEALDGLAKAKRLTAFEVLVPLAMVPPNWRVKDETPPTGERSVYVICRPEHAVEVGNRIFLFAARQGKTKEAVQLDSSLRPHDEWDGRVQGWLELDNGFFFFTDRGMWEQTARLFGVADLAEVSP